MSHWWEGYPWRMIQTNLRETDMADIRADAYAQQLKDFGATVVTLNAAGIIASYDTRLDFQPRNPYLQGDSLRQIIDACHERGIRVIARTDFSKVRRDVYEQHPDWAYRTAAGDIVDYNGDVHVCPNGDYQQARMFDILEEVLTTHPFDGVFCNMSGFLVIDYSGVYHGPCHCENCQRLFHEQSGLELPGRDDPRDPAYARYVAFKAACTRDHKERLVRTIKGISEDLAVNGVDYIRTESNTEIERAPWHYSASSNARRTAGPLRTRPADNASVDFLGFRYRHTSVSPALMALRQWQSLANAGSTSLYIMGRLDNHRDISGFAPTKRVFDFHRRHEDLFRGLTSAAEVVVVHKGLLALNDPEVYGWIRALSESHVPFDEIKLNELDDLAQLADRRVVILGDVRNLAEPQARLFDAYARQGGTVVATGATGLSADNRMLLECLGVKAVTAQADGLMSSVFEVREEETGTFTRCAEAPYIAPGASLVMAEFAEPTTKYLHLIPEHPFGPPERCYYTETVDQPGVTLHPYGHGRGIYIPWLAGSFYFREGYRNTLNFLQDVLFSLCGLPELAPGLTPMVELVICRKENQTVIQLVNGTGCFANSYFEPVPVRDIRLLLPDAQGSGGEGIPAAMASSQTAAASILALNGGRAGMRQTERGLEITLDRLDEFEAIVIRGLP